MKRSALWIAPALLASGCFNTYNYYYAADGGSSGSAGSSGIGSGSTGASSTGGNSTGASSTGGGTTGGASGGGSSGGSTGTAACVSADAGWPLNCSNEVQVYVNRSLPNTSGIADLSMIPMPDGGYLLGILIGSNVSGAQFVAIAPDGTFSDAGFQPCVDQSTDCPYFSLSLVSTGSGPPTMVAGYQAPGSGGSFTSEFACWSPYYGTTPVPVDLSNINNGVEVDLVRTAFSGGRLAVAVSDIEDIQDVLAIGPAGGACPSASSPALNSQGVSGIAVAPSGNSTTPFLVAESFTGPDALTVSLQPGGASYTASFGGATDSNWYWPALATDGTTFSAIVGSDLTGAQLFTGSVPGLAPIYDGGVLSPPVPLSYSATSCGPGCSLTGWIADSKSANPTPTFAFSNPQGCVQNVTFKPFASGGPALTAVASQPGSAVIAYASSIAVSQFNESGSVSIRVCTP